MATRGAVLGVLSQIFDCTSVPYHNHFKIKSFLQYFLKGGSTTLMSKPWPRVPTIPMGAKDHDYPRAINIKIINLKYN